MSPAGPADGDDSFVERPRSLAGRDREAEGRGKGSKQSTSVWISKVSYLWPSWELYEAAIWEAWLVPGNGPGGCLPALAGADREII